MGAKARTLLQYEIMQPKGRKPEIVPYVIIPGLTSLYEVIGGSSLFTMVRFKVTITFFFTGSETRTIPLTFDPGLNFFSGCVSLTSAKCKRGAKAVI